jgi:Outer membrane protein beta-barrel domain
MKKISKLSMFAAMLFFGVNNSASAQLALGLRGGFSFSTLQNFPLDGSITAPDVALAIGNYNAISLEIGIAPWLAIQPEVTYLQKGGKISIPGNANATLKVNMNYLEAPLLAKFRFGKGALKGYALVGPSVGFALNGHIILKTNEENITESIRFDESYTGDNQRDNRFDYSAVAGVGMQYKLGIGSIVLDTRIALDMNDYTKRKGDGLDLGLNTTHWEGFSLSLGYQIEF